MLEGYVTSKIVLGFEKSEKHVRHCGYEKVT